MKRLRKALSLVLALCMILSMAVTVNAEKPQTQAAGAGDDYRRIVHLDAGRKYFSVEQIQEIIDTMADSGYNALELAIGNDGLRFLLDDMSVTIGSASYESSAVTEGIKQGNTNYSHAGELVSAIRRFEKENSPHPGETFFSIGVGGYPEKHFEAQKLDKLIREKIPSGFSVIRV